MINSVKTTSSVVRSNGGAANNAEDTATTFYNGVRFEDNPELTTMVSNLVQVFTNDLISCDMKWSLFVAAATSYRYGTILKPVPPKYLKNDRTCDIKLLLSVINDTPPFEILLKNLNNVHDHDYNTDIIELVHWALITCRDPFLTSVNKCDFTQILNKVQSIIPAAIPTHIFRVECLPKTSVAEQRFLSHARDFTTSFAFHGSKLDSFYSIVNFGLQQHFCKVAAFGEGIYLSSEPSVSIHYCPAGTGWKSSKVGSILSCLSICEYVEHPRYLKCGFKDASTTKNAFGNHVPEKYVLVRNNEIVRVRYLLVFAEKNQLDRPLTMSNSTAVNWIMRNKSLVSIIFYAGLLAFIGFANSKAGVYYRRTFFQFIDEIINRIF